MKVIDYITEQKNDTSLSKHEQIVIGIINAIKNGALKRNSFLPSVNLAVKEIGVARKTIVKAYDELKEKGIIESKKRLGYYVISEEISLNQRVFLLLNAFNMYQEELYNAILSETEGQNISIE